MDICNKWQKDRNTNPLTNRLLKGDSAISEMLDKVCSDSQVCEQFVKNPDVNPVTQRRLGDSSKIKELLRKLCSKDEVKNAVKKATQAEVFVTDHYLTWSPLLCTEYPTVQLREHQLKVCQYVNKNTTLKGWCCFTAWGVEKQ
jgi:hypothetical protein